MERKQQNTGSARRLSSNLNETPAKCDCLHDHDRSRLLDLPRELRDQIIEAVVSPHQAKLITSDHLFPKSASSGLVLMQVCSQLRAETAPIFFGQSKFDANLPNLRVWLRAIETEHVAMIKEVHIASGFIGTPQCCLAAARSWLDDVQTSIGPKLREGALWACASQMQGGIPLPVYINSLGEISTEYLQEPVKERTRKCRICTRIDLLKTGRH